MFDGRVSKLRVHSDESDCVVEPDALVALTMKMFKADNESAEWIEPIGEHSQSEPLVKPLAELMPFGLRAAVATMAKGETAWIWIDWTMGFGSQPMVYGDAESDVIEPKTGLVYMVKLLRWVPAHLSCKPIDPAFPIRQRVTTLPDIEQKFLEVKQSVHNTYRAVHLLLRIIDRLRKLRVDAELEPDKESDRQRLLLSALKLMVTMALHLGRYSCAANYAREAVELSPCDAAIHAELARANFSLGRRSYAWASIKRARLLDPTNKEYAALESELSQYTSIFDDIEDPEDVKSDAETLAELLQERMAQEKKDLLKKMEKRLTAAIDNGATDFVIKGGFPSSILVEIDERLRKKNAENLTVQRYPKSLYVKLRRAPDEL